MRDSFFEKLASNYPFLTICTYSGEEFITIIQNRDDVVTTVYDYGSIVESHLKERFLELGESWWWESNRLIPINLFLKNEWSIFKPYLKTFNNKNLEIIHGPVTSLNELHKRRVKRRSITLVRRLV
jgi:hypothetical protein